MQAVCAEEILPPRSCILGSVSACLKLPGGQRHHLERTLRALPVGALEQLAVAREASIVSFWMLVGGGNCCPLKISLKFWWVCAGNGKAGHRDLSKSFNFAVLQFPLGAGIPLSRVAVTTKWAQTKDMPPTPPRGRTWAHRHSR